MDKDDLECRCNGLEERVNDLENKLKIAELVENGECYDSKVLNRDIERRLSDIENKLKVTELTGKGDRYETKLLTPKEHPVDLGGGAPVDKVKPEHITKTEVNDFLGKVVKNGV